MLLIVWFVFHNCPPLTASVLFALMSPAATLVIRLPPASTPVCVILGPFLIVRPLLFITVFPAVIVLKVGVSTTATLYSVPPFAFVPVVTKILLPAVTEECLPAWPDTTFSWSSVAACPLVILFGSHVLLVSPFTVPAVPLTVTCPALIVPSVPLMLICLEGSLPSVISSFRLTWYVLDPSAFVSEVTVVFLPSATFVVALAAAFFSWLTLTASVSASPAATLVIFLPPASIPDLVTLGPSLILSPSLSTVTAVFPEPS